MTRPAVGARTWPSLACSRITALWALMDFTLLWRDIIGGACLIIHVAGDGAGSDQALGAIIFQLGLIHLRLGGGNLRRIGIALQRQLGIADDRDHLPLIDMVALAHLECDDRAAGAHPRRHA